MTPEQYCSLLRALDHVYLGRPVPRLSASLGSFIRKYALHRNDILKLAIASGLAINRRGEISGNELGPVSVFPIGRFAEPAWRGSHFGAYRNTLVICPELLCVIDLRLWDGSAAGQACIRFFEEATESSPGLRLIGGYRWLPPDRILPGEAGLEPLAGADFPWSEPAFLRYVGEDITRDPHPLEYRPLPTNDEPRLAAIRNTAARVGSRDLLEVPWATGMKSTPLQVRVLRCATDRVSSVLTEGNLVSALLVREPHEEGWWIWDAITIEPEDLDHHMQDWTEFSDLVTKACDWAGRETNQFPLLLASQLRFRRRRINSLAGLE